jgi:hypothetical protein
LESLFRRGFFPVNGEIYSKEGEVICQMANGVEYVLRFGDIAGIEDAAEETPSDGAGEDSEGPSSGVNRYLFVMARFNQDAIAKPELAELPPEEGDAPEGDAPTPDAEEDASAPRDRALQVAFVQEETDASPDAAQVEEATAPVEEPAQENTAETDTAEQDAQEALNALLQDAADAAGQPPVETPASSREAIEQENQRKLDAYNAQVEAGKLRVTELNDRFGDWYYVISDQVYRKIHLSLNDVITVSETQLSPLGEIEELENTPGLLDVIP